MASKKSRGYIILELLAVVLAIVLWFILAEPPQIWEQEDNFDEKCKTNMASLYEAQNYHYRNKGSFCANFDSLFIYLNTDSSLQNSKKLVKCSKDLNSQIEKILQVPELIANDRKISIYIAFDEFQEIERIEPFIINWMRSVFQQQENISYIFLGSRQSLMESIFANLK